MKKTIYIFFIFGCSCLCQSCFNEYPYHDSLLTKPEDVVIGILAPDSAINFTRDYPTEIFVGRMMPANRKNKFLVEGMLDPVLERVMYCARQHYFIYYDYDSLAEVTIRGNEQQIQLTYVGFGIYRDVNRSLRVLPETTYDLTVKKKDGRVFTASTTILKNFEITNPDTMIQYTTSQLDSALIFSRGSRGQKYFTKVVWSGILNHPLYGYTFDSIIPTSFIFTRRLNDTNFYPIVENRYELRAFGQAYGMFHQPYGLSGSNDFLGLYIQLFDMPIEQRSNIQGENVYGVFDCYNATRKKIVFIGIRQ